MLPDIVNIARLSTRTFPLAMLLSVSLALSSCSNLPENPDLNVSELQAVIEGDALMTSGLVISYEPPAHAQLELNDEMRVFLDHYVPKKASTAAKLDALLYSLMHKGILGMDYDPAATRNAVDAFDHQSANCLGFSILFVAMAREVGLRVVFNEVSVPPVWDFQGSQSFILFKHMNSVVTLRGGVKKVVDINMEQYQDHYRQRTLTDSQAMAHYYNNKGVEFLLENNLAMAFNHFRKALEVAPESNFVWSSMGTLYRRAGLYREAELAYLQGLSLDVHNTVILNNLGYLYGAMGDVDLANRYKHKVLTARKNNPYYRYALAKKAFSRDDFTSALEDIQLALTKEKKEHSFWYLAARISDRLDRDEKAKEYLQNAMGLVKDEDVLSHYRETQTRWQASL